MAPPFLRGAGGDRISTPHKFEKPGLTQNNAFPSLRATAKQSQTSNFRSLCVSPEKRYNYPKIKSSSWISSENALVNN